MIFYDNYECWFHRDWKRTSQDLVQHLHKNTDENDDIVGVEVNFTGANWNLDNCRQENLPRGWTYSCIENYVGIQELYLLL